MHPSTKTQRDEPRRTETPSQQYTTLRIRTHQDNKTQPNAQTQPTHRDTPKHTHTPRRNLTHRYDQNDDQTAVHRRTTDRRDGRTEDDTKMTTTATNGRDGRTDDDGTDAQRTTTPDGRTDTEFSEQRNTEHRHINQTHTPTRKFNGYNMVSRAEKQMNDNDYSGTLWNAESFVMHFGWNPLLAVQSEPT